MASPYAKRLAKLEEAFAAKLDRPLATLWVEDGETRDEAIVRAGYDPAQIDRMRFVRWLSAGEGKASPAASIFEAPNMEAEAGPPDEKGLAPDDVPVKVTETSVVYKIDHRDQPPEAALEGAVDPFAEHPDRIAARRLLTAKLREADRAFGKTIA